MKAIKLTVLMAGLALATISCSREKDWTCTCTDTDGDTEMHYFEKIKKKLATDRCKGHEDDYSNISQTCVLDQ
jgi:hypothetical protein